MEKVYQFSYGGKFRKALCKVIHFLYNGVIGMFVLFILASLFSEINYFFRNLLSENVLEIIKAIEIYFSLIAYIATFIPAFIPQKIILNDYEVKIRRNILLLTYLFRGFNDNIMYCEIESVSKSRFKLYDSRFMPLSSAVFVMNDMVKITTYKKEYYVSVKNSDEFIKEVIERANIYRRKHDMEELSSAKNN